MAGVQTLLLVAAADDTGRVATVQRAAGHCGVEARAWVEAEQSGLLSVEVNVGSAADAHGIFLARTTRELRASGETARKRDPSTLLQLTPRSASRPAST